MDRDRWSQGNSKPRDKRQGSQGKGMNLLGRMICGCMHVSVCVCVCVCVCVREREREREIMVIILIIITAIRKER